MARRKTAIAPVKSEVKLPVVYMMKLANKEVLFSIGNISVRTHNPVHINGTQAYFSYDIDYKYAKLDGFWMEGGWLQSSENMRIHADNIKVLCDLADEFARKFEAGEYSEVERG